mgnify:FL=1
MAKISLARKKELNQPDEFITVSNQALEYIKTNRKRIINYTCIVLALVLGYSLYLYYVKTKEDKAFLHFTQDVEWYEKATQASPDAVSLEEIRKKSDAFFDSYSGTAASMLARAHYAGLFFSKGDYAEAAKRYTELLGSARKDESMINLTLCALAQSQEALNKQDEAIRNYETIIQSACPVKKDEALFHLGLIYENKGDSEKSKRSFTRIVNDFPDSIYKDIAQSKISG